MEYMKFIALKIDDFCSSICHEENIGIDEIDKANLLKKDFDTNGYTCIIIKVNSNLAIS